MSRPPSRTTSRTTSEVVTRVASKVLSKVDLSATTSSILQPLQALTAREEEYDPHKHRNVPKPTTYSETMTHMLKACFGAGVLAMPNAYSRLGLVFGTLGTFFLGFFATYCIQILIIASYKVCKKNKVGYLTYPNCMRLALKDGPPCMRWSAAPFAVAVDGFLILWQIGVCSIFLVFVAETLRQVLQFCGHNYSVRIVICCLYPAMVCMCLTKDLKVLAPLSTFSNACNMLGLALVFYYVVHDDLEIDDSKYEIKSVLDVPIFIGLVLYALEAVGVILALEYNMENPKDFTGWCGLFSIGMVIIVLFYSGLGFFGYLKYGMESKASITLNLPQQDKKAQAAHLAFAATIFTSYPLQNFVAWQIIWGLIQHKFSEKKRAADMALRLACSSVPFVMALIAPTLGPIISLVGSVCLSMAAILFPAVIDISAYYPNEYGIGYYKLIADILIIVFGIVCFFSGVYTSVLEILESLP